MLATEEQAEPPSFLDYAQASFSFPLDPWQVQLCGILARCLTEKGLRILIHAPPQIGKTVIVSQRFPAWLIGCRPAERVVLACYNETHATGFGGVVKSLIQSDEHREYFPDSAGTVPENAPNGRFSTLARSRLRDAQASFNAIGLQSGFVGKGVDTLIIDDPYKSLAEAYSPIINEKVWQFWSGTAKVRLNDDTNVIVMFHRYHTDDLAGRMLADDGRWEHYRFAAVADENEDGSDPTGRKPGEPLTPRRSREYFEEIAAKTPDIYLSQFQGKPTVSGGTLIQPAWFGVETWAPKFVRYVRGWDIALSPQRGDYTVGVLLGQDAENQVWLLDVIRTRIAGPDVRSLIESQRSVDPPGTMIAVEESVAALTIIQDLQRMETMRREHFESVPTRGKGKYERALGWLGRARAGDFKVLQRPWIADLFKEFTDFKNLDVDTDDQIDAITVAFEALYQTKGAIQLPPTRVKVGSPEYYEILSKTQNRLSRRR